LVCDEQDIVLEEVASIPIRLDLVLEMHDMEGVDLVQRGKFDLLDVREF
jgi:hypothetical protein